MRAKYEEDGVMSEDEKSTENTEEKIPKNPNEPHKPQKKNHSNKWAPALVGGVVGAALVGMFSLATGSEADDSMNKNEIEQLVQQQVEKQTKENSSSTQTASLDVTTDVSETAAKVQDAVVSVANLSNTNSTVDLFGFGQSESSDSSSEDSYETASEGSGVVYKVDGNDAYVVTNNHVIDGSDAVEIIMNDGTQVEAEIVGKDVWTDLAVLKIPADNVITVAEFGDSDALTVGEQAIAIGSPLGSDFASTVTQGIISGLDRNVPVDLNGDNTYDWQVNAIQTDAAINPGNSGGALLNAAGQVIGINSMKISSDQVEGMGFAIPSNDVQTIIAKLEQDGEVVRPTLGVAMATLNQIPIEQQQEILNIPDDLKEGIVVVDLESGSPAASGGLKVNDIITKFNGEEVTDSVSLRKALYNAGPTDKVEVEFYRDGKQQTATIQLKAQTSDVS